MKSGLLLIMLLILTACSGSMLPGKLYSLGSGQVLQMQIEKARHGGEITAYNPETGERFTGEYTGTYEGGGTTISRTDTFQPMKPMGPDNKPGQGLTTVSTTTPTKAIARAVLIGDKGTNIQLKLDIQPGLNPHGHGEGVDNHGEHYQVQF